MSGKKFCEVEKVLSCKQRISLVITKEKICWIVVAIFWILENITPHSTISQISMLVMAGVLGIYCFSHKRIKMSPVSCSYMLLIVLQFVYWSFGAVMDRNVTGSNLQTMIICLVCSILIYSFLSLKGTNDKIGTFLIYTGLISLLTVMWLCRNSLFTGRMAHAYGKDAVSYYFLGRPVGISSNSIATYSCFGFIFSLIKYSNEKKVKWLVYDAVFLVGIILTGSRKGLLMMGAFWIIYELIIKKNRDVVLKAIGIILAVLAGYIIVTSVPALRNIIGERLEELIVNKLTGKAVSEGSITARARYASYAVEIIKHKYLLGNGLGWFKSVYGNVTENNYYELLVGCGIFGLLVNYSFVPNAIRLMFIHKKNAYCLAMGMVLIVLLIIEWGSVEYLSWDTIIYKSLFYLAVSQRKNRRTNGEITYD